MVREEKEQLRKTQDRHKYMMGGCVVKYFPEAYDYRTENNGILYSGMTYWNTLLKSDAEKGKM